MQGLYPIYKPRKNKENRRMNDIMGDTSRKRTKETDSSIK